jgi:four helix bundle protein
MIYGLTKSFPAGERFGLVCQMRRAAVSIPSNIAEGQARRTTGEFIQFISHAEGSLAELETQVIVSVDLGYWQRSQLDELFSELDQLKKMLNALRRKLSSRSV